MKDVYIVHSIAGFAGAYDNFEDAFEMANATAKDLGMSGYNDTRVFVRKGEINGKIENAPVYTTC